MLPMTLTGVFTLLFCPIPWKHSFYDIGGLEVQWLSECHTGSPMVTVGWNPPPSLSLLMPSTCPCWIPERSHTVFCLLSPSWIDRNIHTGTFAEGIICRFKLFCERNRGFCHAETERGWEFYGILDWPLGVTAEGLMVRIKSPSSLPHLFCR